MDRPIVYPGAIPLETDILSTARSALIGLGVLSMDMVGTQTLAAGLPCTPGPGLEVSVGAGRIYAVAPIDSTPYSSLPSNANLIVKQGLSFSPVLLNCPAPSSGSVNYLIEATYGDADTNLTTLPYYNASNPAQAYSGPQDNGQAQATVRQGQVMLRAKAGVPAPSGSQATPAADPNYIGLYSVTVAAGQSQIVAANIVAITTSLLVPGPYQPQGAYATTAAMNAAIAASATTTLASAENYAAGVGTAAENYAVAADNVVLSNAEAYAVTQANAALAAAESYTAANYVAHTGVALTWSSDPGTYFKLATLPASAGGTADSIHIIATLNTNYTAAQDTMIDGIFGNRNGFSYVYNVFGPNVSATAIVCYAEANGTTSVYAVCTTTFGFANVTILNCGIAGITSPPATLYPVPPSTTAPTGTLCFSTGLPATYPPYLNLAAPLSYLTPALAASTYATIASVTAAITTAETYAKGTSSLTANGYEVLPSGKVNQWGVYTGGGGSPQSVTFPVAFPTGCLSITPVPYGANETIYLANAPSASKTGFTVNVGATGVAFSWTAQGH